MKSSRYKQGRFCVTCTYVLYFWAYILTSSWLSFIRSVFRVRHYDMTLLCVFPVCSLEEKLFYCLMLMVCISGHVMKSWFNTCQSPSGGWWLPVFLLPCSLILTCRLPLSCLRDLSCWLYSPTSRLHPPVVWWVAGISTVWRVWDCKEMCACVSCLIFKPVCRRVWT